MQNTRFDSLKWSNPRSLSCESSTCSWMLWKEILFCYKYSNSDCQVSDFHYTKIFAKLLLDQVLGWWGAFGASWSNDSWEDESGLMPFLLLLHWFWCLNVPWVNWTCKNGKKMSAAEEGEAVHRHDESNCSMLQCQNFCKSRARVAWGEVYQWEGKAVIPPLLRSC